MYKTAHPALAEESGLQVVVIIHNILLFVPKWHISNLPAARSLGTWSTNTSILNDFSKLWNWFHLRLKHVTTWWQQMLETSYQTSKIQVCLQLSGTIVSSKIMAEYWVELSIRDLLGLAIFFWIFATFQAGKKFCTVVLEFPINEASFFAGAIAWERIKVIPFCCSVREAESPIF